MNSNMKITPNTAEIPICWKSVQTMRMIGRAKQKGMMQVETKNHLFVHQIRDGKCFDGSHPEEMQKNDGNVQTTNVIRQQVDYLTNRRFTQRIFAQSQRFPIDHAAQGNTHLHSQMHLAQQVWMHEHDVESTRQHDSRRIEIRLEHVTELIRKMVLQCVQH